ncbi:MAG: AraC family transcriptional regulator [Steroidobacteraceae bacterium]
MPDSPAPRVIRPSARLAQLVEGFWEWDFADGTLARSLKGQVLPSICPQFVVHYREPMISDRLLSRGPYSQMAIGIQTEVATIRALGPVGAIKVRFKPEALPLLLRPSLRELQDSEVDLHDLFAPAAIRELTERLAEAATTSERIALFESFLIARMSPDPTSSVVQRTALYLRQRPHLPVQQIASHFNISQRQLSRQFRNSFGVSPKQFSKIQRIANVLALRRRGMTWVDIASHCGFTDQSHLINDFRGIVGRAPDDFFRTVAAGSVGSLNLGGLNERLGRSGFNNSFIV